MSARENQFCLIRAALREQQRVKKRILINEFLWVACTVAAIILAVAGCATPPAYPSVAASSCQSRDSKEGLTIATRPILDKQELEQYFGTDLLSRGILPVLIVAENRSADASYLLAKENCSLDQASGFANKENLPARQATSTSVGVFISPIIGGAIASDAQSKRTGMAVEELRDQTVSPGQAEQGFVYFTLSDKRPERGSRLVTRVRVPRLGANRALEFELPFVWER